MSELKPCQSVLRDARDGEDVYAHEMLLAERKGLQWTEVGAPREPGARADTPGQEHVVVIKFGDGIKPVTIMGFSDEPDFLAADRRFWSGKDRR